VAPNHLLRHDGVGEAVSVHTPLTTGVSRPMKSVGALAFFLVLRAGCAMSPLRRSTAPARALLREGADRQQRACARPENDDRIGRLSGKFDAGKRTALQAFLGGRSGVPDRRLRIAARPLHADADALPRSSSVNIAGRPDFPRRPATHGAS